MDIIPYVRFIAGIILFGLSFFFLDMMLNTLMETVVTPTHVMFSAMLWLFSILPGIVLFSSGIRLIMVNQKRY